MNVVNRVSGFPLWAGVGAIGCDLRRSARARIEVPV